MLRTGKGMLSNGSHPLAMYALGYWWKWNDIGQHANTTSLWWIEIAGMLKTRVNLPFHNFFCSFFLFVDASCGEKTREKSTFSSLSLPIVECLFVIQLVALVSLIKIMFLHPNVVVGVRLGLVVAGKVHQAAQHHLERIPKQHHEAVHLPRQSAKPELDRRIAP